jgi:hypothetical protein
MVARAEHGQRLPVAGPQQAVVVHGQKPLAGGQLTVLRRHPERPNRTLK